MVQIVIGQAKQNRYVDTLSFGPRYLHTMDQIAELRLTSNAPNKSLITIKQKLQLNNIYRRRRPPAPRPSPAESPEHTHQSAAGVSRFRALPGPRLQDVQNMLPTGQRVGRREPPSNWLTDWLLTDWAPLLHSNWLNHWLSLALIYPCHHQRTPPDVVTTGRIT